jgi:hypothetical protein
MSNTDFGKTITGLNTIQCDYIYTNYDNQNNYLEANYYNYIPSQNIITLSGITGNIQNQINNLTYSSLSGNIYFNNQLQNYLLSSTASSTYCTISSLIFYNTQKKTDAVFVLSGHQGFDYWNQSYVDRYFDIIDYVEKYNSKKDTKFFLLGKLQSIPEQKILESLIIDQGVEKQNINVIYKEYVSSENALKLLITEINKNNNISSITIITSPYHSYRLSQIWQNISNENYDTVFFKNKNSPKKNSFFERSMNKKEIVYELLANVYYISQKKFIYFSSLIRIYTKLF